MDGKHFSNDEQNDHPLEKESNYMLKNVLHNKIAENKVECFASLFWGSTIFKNDPRRPRVIKKFETLKKVKLSPPPQKTHEGIEGIAKISKLKHDENSNSKAFVQNLSI